MDGPLHYTAVRTHCKGAVRALLDNGADPAIRNKDASTEELAAEGKPPFQFTTMAQGAVLADRHRPVDYNGTWAPTTPPRRVSRAANQVCAILYRAATTS